jgi:hypothetical protein
MQWTSEGYVFLQWNNRDSRGPRLVKNCSSIGLNMKGVILSKKYPGWTDQETIMR